MTSPKWWNKIHKGKQNHCTEAEKTSKEFEMMTIRASGLKAADESKIVGQTGLSEVLSNKWFEKLTNKESPALLR